MTSPMKSANVLVVTRMYTKLGSARNTGQQAHSNALITAATVLDTKVVSAQNIERLMPMASANVLVVTRMYTKLGSARNTGQQVHANALITAATVLDTKVVSAQSIERLMPMTSANVLVVKRMYTKMGSVKNTG